MSQVGAAQGGGPQAAGPRSGGWLLPLMVVIIGSFMTILDSTIVNVAIPTLQSQFGATTDQVQWVVTIFLLVLGVVVPASGWLSDRFGLSRIYVVSLIIFTAGSALCGLATSLNELIFFRLLQGVGGGLMGPITMSMVYRIVPRERIGTAMGIYGLTVAFGPALGPTVGGYLVQYIDWRLIFYINVPIGILGTALALAVLPPMEGHASRPFDTWGFVTSALGLGTLLYVLSEGQTWGWTSEASVLLLIASIWLLAIFVVIELTVDHPLLDLRLFRRAAFSVSSVLIFVVVVALYSGSFYVPLFMQEIQGMGAFATGMALLPGALCMGALMPISGRLYDAVGARLPAAVGLAVLTWSTFLFLGLDYATPSGTIALWMAARYAGLALAMMPIITAGLSVVPGPEIPGASAINNIVQRASGSLGLAVLTSVFTSRDAQRYSDLANHVSRFSQPLAGLEHTAAALGGLGASGVPAPDVAMLIIGRAIDIRAFTGAVHDIFAYAVAMAAAGIVLVLFLREQRRAGGGPRPHLAAD